MICSNSFLFSIREMSRPASAKTYGTGAGTLSSVDKASYEDLLVAQYLDELRKSAQHGQQSYVFKCNVYKIYGYIH